MKLSLIILTLLILTTSIKANEESININLNLNNPCETILTIETNKDIYESKEQISFYNNLSQQINNFQIKYYIIDINNNVVKQPIITKNLNEKHYTPKETKESQLLIIKSELIQNNCETIETEKVIKINGNPNFIEKITANKTSTIKNQKEIKQPTKTSEKTTTNKTQQTPTSQVKSSYQITPITESAKFLNQDLNKTGTETVFISGEEKSRIVAPFMFIIAIILFIIGIKKHGIKNTSNN